MLGMHVCRVFQEWDWTQPKITIVPSVTFNIVLPVTEMLPNVLRVPLGIIFKILACCNSFQQLTQQTQLIQLLTQQTQLIQPPTQHQQYKFYNK